LHDTALTRRIEIDSADQDTRLDVLLARELGLSRGYVRRLLSGDRVRLNGQPAQKGALLRVGDAIEVAEFRHPGEGPIAHADFDLVVLDERSGLIAVDKPAGRATQPLTYDEGGTVLNAVLARYPDMNGVGEGGLMSGVVHRLDRETSGVLLFARDDDAWGRARDAFAAERVRKVYRALVHGRLQDERDVELQLEHRGTRMRVVSSGGLRAATRLRPIAERGEHTLVEAFPRTGRMHQIRATLAELGHPVVGDRLYGSSANEARHWLHALEIELDGFAIRAAPPERLA